MIRPRTLRQTCALALLLTGMAQSVAAQPPPRPVETPGQVQRKVLTREEMLRPEDQLQVFPYQLVNYTKAAHDGRIQNAVFTVPSDGYVKISPGSYRLANGPMADAPSQASLLSR